MDNTKKNDRRISIVLNGKEKTYEELEKDKHAYEQLLNEEISATKEEEGDEFPWLLSEKQEKNQSTSKVVDLGARRRDKKKLEAPFWDDGKREHSPKLPHTKRKKKKRFDFKAVPLALIGIVISAIIVGTSFGFMMLTIFKDKTNQEVMTNSPQAPVSVDLPVVATEGEVPVLAVELVQGGAFSLIEKAEETVLIVQEKGFAATLSTTSDPVYLFIGLGLDREQARVLGEKYQANGQEVYLKPYAITSSAVIEKEEQTLFLMTGIELYQQLTLLSVNGFANGGSLFTENMLADVKGIHDKFLSYQTVFSESDEQKYAAATWTQSLTSALEVLESYATSRDETQLWQVQQYLLNGLIAYEQLLKTF